VTSCPILLLSPNLSRNPSRNLNPSRPVPDNNTPDVIDGRSFLDMAKPDAMRAAGIKTEADYARAYKDVEQMVSARDNRESQTGVHVPVVVKVAGKPVRDA